MAKSIRETPTTKDSEPEIVDAYMRRLKHPLKDVAEALREIILTSDKSIGEEIAWNAPAFFYTGELRPFKPKEYKRFIVGFNFFKQDCIRLIFLRGASANDSSGLLEGDYEDGRRLAIFNDMQEVKKNKKDLQQIVKTLAKQIPSL